MKPLIFLMALPATLTLSVSLATESKFDGGLPRSASGTGAASATAGRPVLKAEPSVSKHAGSAAGGRDEDESASRRPNSDLTGTSACRNGKVKAEDCRAGSQQNSKQAPKEKPKETKEAKEAKDRSDAGATANEQLKAIKERVRNDLTDVQGAASKAEERLGDQRIPPIDDNEEFLN